MKLRSVCSLIFVLVGLTEAGAFQMFTVDTFTTDERLDPGEAPHFVFEPDSGRESGYLFLFYPGTGADPSDYQRLMETAAGMGHHVIGLSYVNDESINRDICLDAMSPECFRLARLEIHTGEDSHEDLIEIVVLRPNWGRG